MRAVDLPAALLAVALLLAGCSGNGPATTPAGLDVADAIPGQLCVVIVDEAIRPIEGAQVLLSGAAVNRSTVTGGNGLACFEVPDGSYIIEVRHGMYQITQTTTQFGGDAQPQVIKIQLTRLFLQDPYHETRQLEGFIQCGYAIRGVMSSLCLNDYTHFVGPYTCPQCEHLLDRRSADFEVGNGWQTMVMEMTWQPTQQATSDEMSLTISHFPRAASHWYCQGAGVTPLLVRMEVGVVCENQQSEPELVPPEGLPNMHLFAATSPGADPASMVISQKFTVYLNVFYNGKPPEGWSFVAGDPMPF